MKTEYIVTIAIVAIILLCWVVVERSKISAWLSKQSVKDRIADLCRQAEMIITGTKKGEERLDWVVNEIYKRLPENLTGLLTKPFLKAMIVKAINIIFEQISVVLEDGTRRAI